MLDISRRTIALAEYIVHSDGEWGEDSRPRIARDIRVALEFPFAKPADGRTSNLWLSINISEYHLEYIPLIETAPSQGSSSEQTGNVSAFASAASSLSSSSTVTPTTPTRQLPPLTLLCTRVPQVASMCATYGSAFVSGDGAPHYSLNLFEEP